MLSQNESSGFIYLDKYHKSDIPPHSIMLIKACRADKRLRPTNEKNTGTSKAGMPIEPNASQIPTTDSKNKAQTIAIAADKIRPTRV